MTKLNEMSYGELIEHVDDVIRALRIKAYGEGYEQGRFEQRLESELDDVTKETEGELPQDRRDKIVEQAKKDFKELTKLWGNGRDGYYVGPSSHSGLSKAVWYINRKSGVIVVVMKGWTGKRTAKGIAKCLPTDCFNVHIGKAIALRRALGLEVPYEYLNTPQPTEARVGDIIQYAPTFSYRVDTVCGNVFDLVCIENGESYGGWVSSPNEYKIIDDSREGVTE